MEYLVTIDDGSEYLMHFGRKGMKWGVWNAETAARYKGGDSSLKGAKKTVRTLNALDKRKAIEKGKLIDAEKKMERMEDKALKAYKKGNMERGDKIMDYDYNVARDKSYDHRAAVSKIEKHQNKLSRKLVNEGYSVKTKNIRRSTLTNGQKALQVVLNAGAAAAGSPVAYAYNRTVSGTKYKLEKK